MRLLKGHDSRCPVVDDAPALDARNETAVAVYFEARPSAEQIVADDKTYVHARPADLSALFDVHGVPRSERPGTLRRVLALEEIANRLRRPHPKAKHPGRG